MTSIFGSVLKIVAIFFGDHFLAKWINNFRIMWEKKAGPKLKAKVEKDYNERTKDWDQAKDKRQSL